MMQRQENDQPLRPILDWNVTELRPDMRCEATPKWRSPARLVACRSADADELQLVPHAGAADAAERAGVVALYPFDQTELRLTSATSGSTASPRSSTATWQQSGNV
jgi:hypothetical protein